MFNKHLLCTIYHFKFFFFLFEKIFEILLHTYKNYFFKKASSSNVTIPMSM